MHKLTESIFNNLKEDKKSNKLNESDNPFYDEAIDEDPDLDRDQVDSDVDYWTDVDETNTEDVSNVEPIGVYTISNTNAIYVYEIDYDINDKVLVGDSSDTTKAHWTDIIYEPDDTYFYYGDIKVPFNEVIRTNI